MIVSPTIMGNLKDRANNNVWDVVGQGAPVSGVSGTGVGLLGPGSTYVDTNTGSMYRNTGTILSPTWTVFA